VLDERNVRFTLDKPNPRFLPQLAGAMDPNIYRPSHYLKRFHAKYTDKAKLEETAKKQKLKSWAALHNRMDDMKEQSNPDLPTLQPWRVMTAAPASRFIFERNLSRPHRHGRIGGRPLCRQSQCGRGRSPVSRPVHV
jgi:peptide/nickel transport system substrate-binding protein